jgi:hypothetical protein
MNIINAFIRWREFGNQTWEYPGSDFDVYVITSWTYRIKDQIVREVLKYDDNNETKYIEAAIAAEMYRIILNGEYREKSLVNLTSRYLLCDHSAKNRKSFHSKAWNDLLSIMHQEGADNTNKDTVRSYFNLSQGSTTASVIVLDAINLSKTIRKVKTNKLKIPEEEMQFDDRVKMRRDTYSLLADITSRVKNVAQAELAAAKIIIRPIYDCFDDDEIEDEDIEAFINRIGLFYKEIDETQINIKTVSTDEVKKNYKQISKAISDIGAVLNEEDPLTVLMAFSGDPIGILKPMVSLISQVSNDVSEADKQISKRKNALVVSEEETEIKARYRNELAAIENDMILLGEL